MILGILFFPIIIIYLLLTIRQRIKRGQKLTDKDLATIIFMGLIGVIVVLIPQDLDFIWRIAFAIVFILGGIVFYLIVRNIESKNKKPQFQSVTLHYPFPNVTIDNYHRLIPEYITNNNTWQAYPLSKNILRLCVQSREIGSYAPYPNSEVLKATLMQFHTINSEPATLDNLNLLLKGDNITLISVPNPISNIEMEKLRKQKSLGAFKDLRLVFIHSFQYFTDDKKKADFPTNRRLLIDLNKRTARQPPIGDLWMWKEGLFEVKECRKKLPCLLGIWSFFYEPKKNFLKPIRYKKNEQYEISELIRM